MVCLLALTTGLISRSICSPKPMYSINRPNLSRPMSNYLSLRCYCKVLPIFSTRNPFRWIFQDRNLNQHSMVPKWTMISTIPRLKMAEVQITGEWVDQRTLWSKSPFLRSGYLRTYRNHSLRSLRKLILLTKQDSQLDKLWIGSKTSER